MGRFSRSIGRGIDELEVRRSLGGAGAEPSQSIVDDPSDAISQTQAAIANGLPEVQFGLKAIYRPLSRVSNVVRSDLLESEDHRKFSPQYKMRTPRRVAQIITNQKTARSLRPSLSSQLQFKDKKHTLICVRRKIRKEVILAKGRGGANRRPRRNPNSNIWC